MSDHDDLARLVMIAADSAAIAARAAGSTTHHMTKAAVLAALDCALRNGLIRIVPRSQWPEYVIVDPLPTQETTS